MPGVRVDEPSAGRYNPAMGHTLLFALLALPGWDPCKWTDPRHQTPKYVVGRLMAPLPPSPDSLAALLPAIRRRYPGASVVPGDGMDKIDIPCVGVVDAIVNSGGKENPGSGDAWDWQIVEDKCEACAPNRCEAVSKSESCGR